MNRKRTIPAQNHTSKQRSFRASLAQAPGETFDAPIARSGGILAPHMLPMSTALQILELVEGLMHA
jgi:hypothetical protein